MRVRNLPAHGGAAYWLSWLLIGLVALIAGALLAGLIAGALALQKELTNVTEPTATTFTRTPDLDLRIMQGDAFDADAWQCGAGHRLWTVVDYRPLSCARCESPQAACAAMGAWADLIRE